MSLIQKSYNKGEDRHDLKVKMMSAEHKRTFEFTVRRNRVDVRCLNEQKLKPGQANYNYWRNALSGAEQLRVFALMLDEYRKHSIGDEHGYRGAVLGVAENGQLFLGANTATEQVTSPYFKECAEQNMVSAASDIIAYEQVKRSGWDKIKRPKAPRFEAIYMMGGVDETQVPVSCPCGKCTDMLAKNMTEHGKIYALPILNAATFAQLDKNSAYQIGINHEKTLAGVRAQVQRKKPSHEALASYPVWQTTIEHLNAHREIRFQDNEQNLVQMQRQAYDKLYQQFKERASLHDESAKRNVALAIQQVAKEPQAPRSGWDVFSGILNAVLHAGHRLNHNLTAALGIRQNDAVIQAAANQFIGRHSIAELDAACKAGKPDIAAINRFMLSEIQHIGADRIANDPDMKRAWKRTIAKNLPHVRCVVMQLDDGTFHSATECAGKYDASLPNAEAAAVVNALPALASAGIRDVWVLEANGKAVQQGVLPTSPKEGVERIIKRASKAGVQFHFIPLNDGDLNSETLHRISRHYSDEAIFPALFKGSRPLDAAEKPPKRAWTDFITQNLAPAMGGRAVG